MNNRTRNIPLELADGTVIKVEASLIGEQKVAFKSRAFKEATKIIESLANELEETFQKVKPNKVAVTFGLEIGVESGQLTTLLVQGSSKANLEVSLEWEKK